MSMSHVDFLQPFEMISRLMERGPDQHGSRKVILINDPVDVQTVMHSPSIVRSEAMRTLAGDGLIFSDGDKWRERRRSMQPSFPPADPDRHVGEVDWAVAGLVSRLEDFADGPDTFQLLDEMLRFTTRLIYRVAFGIELEVDHETGPMLIRFFDAAARTSMAFIDAQSPLDISAMRTFQSARKELDLEIESIIERGRRTGVGEDHVLGVLLRMVSGESGFTEEDVQDEIRTLLLAGAETTSNVLTWLFLLLDAHPNVRSEIESELDVDSESELLQASILETLRLFPPVWFISRQAIAPVTVSECTFDEGDWAFICTYLVQRNPDYWNEPNSFLPGRFAKGFKLPHRYSWFPFGGGRHLCLGKALGELESFESARSIMKSFRLVRADSEPLPPRIGLVLKPLHDVPMRVERRTSGDDSART
ncbi:MAG: cytochrome P450 [Phycisphaerales bacterium]|nr:cytochrome P450 [Phycisphaerales bacterium]